MGKRVLVVDDEKLIVKGIRFSLEQDGMEVDCAYDGEEALSMAKEQMKSSYIFGQENVASRMFANGKNLILLDRIFTPDEVVKSIDKVSLEDIDQVKRLICDPTAYTGVAVTNKRIDWKKIWKWQ